MELFPLNSRRKIVVRVIPRFPARVNGGAGISVERSNGTYDFALDFETLTTIGEAESTDKVAVQRADGSYAVITAADFASAGTVSDFTDLGDVPASYTGESDKTVRVKSDESGLEFGLRMLVMDQATYDGLTPDADTLYFVTA